MKNLDRFAELFDLSGYVAVVTGAAQGNGLGIANALHDAGAAVIAADLAFPTETEGARHKLHPEIRRMVMDVTDEESVKTVFARIFEEYEKLDILCNNAGIIYKDLVQDLDIARFRRVSEVNIHGVVICTKHAVPYMKRAGWGRIVNVSSSQAFLTTETYSAYAASKAALIGLTRSLAAELAPSHIRVNCVAPGVIRTDMVEALGEETIASLAEQTPAGRLGTPEDVAKAVAFLAGPEADFITGQVLTVDGGFIL